MDGFLELRSSGPFGGETKDNDLWLQKSCILTQPAARGIFAYS